MEQPRIQTPPEVGLVFSEVAQGTRLITYAFYASELDPVPGSNLDRLDLLYPFEKVSVRARHYVSAALEHMNMWADFVAPRRFHPQQTTLINMRPVYALSRAALETAAQAVWLLEATDVYGTTKWKASYGRRSAVESTNACAKVHHARLTRHSTRVRGTERNGILLSFILAAVNASILLTRYGYDVGDPPQVADDEVIEPLPSGRPTKALHRQRKFSRPRRAQAPPGSAHTGPPTTPWVTVKRTAKSPGKRSVKAK